MGRLWLVVALLGMLAGTAAAKREPACACRTERTLPRFFSTGVPTNARFWTLPASGTTSAPDQPIQSFELQPHTAYKLAAQQLTFTTGAGRDDTPPMEPGIGNVSIELVRERSEVSSLVISGTFDQDTAVVRVNLVTATGSTIYYMTPDELRICDTGIALEPGPVHVEVVALDLAGNASSPAAFDTTAVFESDFHPTCVRPHRQCGTGLMGLLLLAPLLFGIVLLVVLVVVSRVRASLRRKAPVEQLGVGGAEYLARAVRLQALIIAAALTGWVSYAKVGDSEDAVLYLIWFSPLVAVIVIAALLRWIDARRVLRLLSYDGVTATTQRDQLAVTVGHANASLRAAPWLVRRARRNALPKASL